MLSGRMINAVCNIGMLIFDSAINNDLASCQQTRNWQ